MERLTASFLPYQSILAEAAFSAIKVLERGAGQLQYQLNELLTGLTTPHEKHNENSGLRDTLNCYTVAKMAYLTFIVSGQYFNILSSSGHDSDNVLTLYIDRDAVGCE